MVVTPAMAEGIESGLPITKLRQIGLTDGMVELAAAGMEQVLAGRTTLEEVFYKLSG
jgi:type IV pilus assembly protein PilB